MTDRFTESVVEDAALKKKKTLELLEKANEEYRVFFQQPKTTFEYWSAIKFAY